MANKVDLSNALVTCSLTGIRLSPNVRDEAHGRDDDDAAHHERFCTTCQVILCSHCHQKFHDRVVPLPECSPYRGLFQRVSRSVVTPSATPKTTVRVSRNRDAAPTSPSRRTPPSARAVRHQNSTGAARGAAEAEVTSPPRMQRQKKMRQFKNTEKLPPHLPTRQSLRQKQKRNAEKGDGV